MFSFRGRKELVRQKFPLSSEQLELLLAFEKGGSLQQLAKMMAKDSSVVSRNLQRVAEICPVIAKVNGRWQITPLGRQINQQTKMYLDCLHMHLNESLENKNSKQKKDQFKNAALIVINAQNGLLDPLMGSRCNSEAEENISKIISKWRMNNLCIIHVRHVSEDRKSLFFKESPGVNFIRALAPEKNELTIDKAKSSAFSETSLLEELTGRGIETIVLTGFTANECIDATARQANEFGFSTIVIGDATATFDFLGHDGKIYKADRVHKLILANLHALFSEIMTTETLVRLMSHT